jgi:nitrogen fixation protein FixH
MAKWTTDSFKLTAKQKKNNKYKYTQLRMLMIIMNFNGYILLLNLLLFTNNQQEVYTVTTYMILYVYYSV